MNAAGKGVVLILAFVTSGCAHRGVPEYSLTQVWDRPTTAGPNDAFKRDSHECAVEDEMLNHQDYMRTMACVHSTPATLQYVCYNQTKTSRWASCIKARGWYFVESYRTPAWYPSQDVSNASGIGAALKGKPGVVYEPPNGAIVTK